MHLLLAAEVVCCKNGVATRCKVCSLLIAEVGRCKNLLVTRFKIRSLLVAESARFENSLLNCKVCSLYSLQKLLVSKICALLVAKFAH